MMNHSLLFFLCTLLSAHVVLAQETTDDYRPFIEEGKVWYLLNTEDMYRTPRRNYFDGDTLIAGKHCKKWIQEESVYRPPELTVNRLYAYEEDKRVCFFQEGDTIPHLFFDFGAEIGDTLIVQLAWARAFVETLIWAEKQTPPKDAAKEYVDIYTDTLIITQKGKKEFGNHMHKCIWFNHMERGREFSSHWDFMMEGVGSLTAPYWNIPSSTMLNLIACTVGDEVLFWGDNADSWGLQRPTSISSLTKHTAPLTKGCFDLSGRRLAAPPAKGMYIENGRKRVVK